MNLGNYVEAEFGVLLDVHWHFIINTPYLVSIKTILAYRPCTMPILYCGKVWVLWFYIHSAADISPLHV